MAPEVEDPEHPSTPIDINIVLRCVLKSDVPRFVKCFEDEEDPFKVRRCDEITPGRLPTYSVSSQVNNFTC